MRVIVACLLLLASSVGLAQFNVADNTNDPWGTATGPQFLPVDEAYQLAIEPGGGQTLRLYWQIADGYYMYQHRFAFAVRDGRGAVPLQAVLPPALARTDEFFGEVKVYYHSADISLELERATDSAELIVSSQGCADAGLCYPPEQQYFTVSFTSGEVTENSVPAPGVAAAGSKAVAAPPPQARYASLWSMLVLAVLGGAILNLMPCVFPILSLKVIGLTAAGGGEWQRHGWLYAAGVISSFVAIAALLIGLQQAGRAIGWGFQLQSTGFVIGLAYLFLAMGLALSGLVQFGGGIMNLGSGLTQRGGAAGSFFTGVLAVVVASPCTAPFMGTALGFAATQPPPVALVVFAALGAGMAAPLVLLSYSRTARLWLPKPGPWMENLKQLLAFPLYATAIWLLWVAGRQTGVDTMAAALAGALMLALALWLWRESTPRRALALLCLAAAVGLASWRGPGDGNAVDSYRGVGEPWSPARLQELRQAGKPVFVDVTADWCITCIANERAVLHTREMTAAFASHGVTYMVADWTNYSAEIANYLRQHGRNGIPLYLLYPADPTAEVRLLPQLLTKAIVFAELRSAAPVNSDVIGGL